MELNAKVGAYAGEIIKRGEKHIAHAEKPQWNRGLFGKVEFPIQKSGEEYSSSSQGAWTIGEFHVEVLPELSPS